MAASTKISDLIEELKEELFLAEANGNYWGANKIHNEIKHYEKLLKKQ